MIKQIWILIKRGLILWLVLGLVTFVVLWFVGFLNQIDYKFVDNNFINFLIKCCVLGGLIVATGVFLSVRWLKSWLLNSRIPWISSLVLLFFGEEKDESDLKEVLFYIEGNSWTIGIVTAKVDLPVNPYDLVSPLVRWCVVLGPPTPPFSFTSQLRLVPESRVIYTGRTAIDTTLSVAALGSKLTLDYRKFKIVNQKPAQ